MNPATAHPHPNLPADWLARLRQALSATPDHDPAGWRRAGVPVAEGAAAAWFTAPTPVAAAVLVPIILDAAGPAVLLTTRAGHLRHHGGQISFPGGQLEQGDEDLVSAALRETREETGIEPQFIEPIGFLPDCIVPTGFRITPVVALVHPGFTLQPAANEVAEVFHMPLEFISQRANFRPVQRTLRGIEVAFNDLHFEGRTVWGATAGMLMMLHQALGGDAASLAGKA